MQNLVVCGGFLILRDVAAQVQYDAQVEEEAENEGD